MIVIECFLFFFYSVYQKKLDKFEKEMAAKY